jgi:hypothetical protein
MLGESRLRFGSTQGEEGMHKYWVVGAAFGGKDDVLGLFKRRGYWYCWDANYDHQISQDTKPSVVAQQDLFRRIEAGDRIAVKRMLGQGAKDIAILALGIVKEVDLAEWRVYVDWLPVGNLDRHVPMHGCGASIHGPFSADDPWVHQVFLI